MCVQIFCVEARIIQRMCIGGKMGIEELNSTDMYLVGFGLNSLTLNGSSAINYLYVKLWTGNF